MATAKRIKKKKPKWYFGHAFDSYLSKGCREKYQAQRKMRGWDDSETWNLDLTMAQFILPRLRRLEEMTIGHPKDLTLEEWQFLLKKMITAFEKLQRNKWDFLAQEEATEKEKAIQEGLEAFAKYYRNLWW